MHLAADWLRANAAPLSRGSVLTVDHGLRPGSAREAAATAAWARAIGFSACTLKRRGARPRSNVEDSARNARYRLIGDWCRANRVGTLLLGHTRDDQAETFLLRLARGSGVDGLSAMRGRSPFPLPGYDEIELVRPLLDIGRDELRAGLSSRGAVSLDDPMNEDSRFARVRIRQAMPALEAAGLSATRIAQAARHLGRAREALDADMKRFLDRHVRFAGEGGAFLDIAALRAEPREIGLRALSAVLMRVSGKAYRPRFERLEHLYDSLLESVSLRPKHRSHSSLPSTLEGEGGPKGRKGGDDSMRSESVFGSATRRTLSGCRIGPASKEFRHFGTATLEIRREKPRKQLAAHKKHAAETLPETLIPEAGAKLPKKRRIIARLSGS